MTKVSNDIRLRIAREIKSDIWKLDKLMNNIREEVEACETSKGGKITEFKSPGSFGQNRVSTNRSPSASALVSTEIHIQCAYCGAPHYSASCDKVVSPRDRRDVLLKAGKCFNCLRSNHKVKNCRNKHSCRNCQGRYHHSICEVQRENPRSPNSLSVPVSQTNDTNVKASNASTLNATTKNRGTILLQTAQVMAVNPTNGQFRRIRLLFDNGSQRSYVTEGLCATLNLKTSRNERLQLNTFGDRNHRTKNCAVVQLGLHGVNSSDCTEVTALSFPAICTTLPSVVSINDLPHLKGLELADDPNNPCDRIDVLIASDFYWDFMSGDTTIRDKGPIAINSKLGWLLSGPIGTTAFTNLVLSHMIVAENTDDPLDLQTDDQ